LRFFIASQPRSRRPVVVAALWRVPPANRTGFNHAVRPKPENHAPQKNLAKAMPKVSPLKANRVVMTMLRKMQAGGIRELKRTRWMFATVGCDNRQKRKWNIKFLGPFHEVKIR
jgi:hypothetical protein